LDNETRQIMGLQEVLLIESIVEVLLLVDEELVVA
jgi:hypothetical protein